MTEQRMRTLAAPSRTTVVLVGAAALAWAVTVDRMRGMDAGPGMELGGISWYLGIWVTMTAAMMLPSVVHVARTVLFVAGYLAVWTVYGLAAYVFYSLVSGPYVAGAVIVAAGLYELTPLKRRSLHDCRTAPDSGNGLRSGLTNGLDCVGASGGLMAVLVALGVMSVFWMVVVAAAIFAEKVLPQGQRLPRLVAPALVALGIWVAVSPGNIPGLSA
jgi:predicted metal-binding membrane protein